MSPILRYSRSALWALLTGALVLSSGVVAQAAPAGEGVGATSSLSRVERGTAPGSAIEAAALASPLGVVLTLDRADAVVGDELTVSWDAQGGEAPEVFAIEAWTEIDDAPVEFLTGWEVSGPFPAERSGSVTLTVPGSGDRLSVLVGVRDGGEEHWFSTDALGVVGFDRGSYRGFGYVRNVATGAEGVGYFAGGGVVRGWFLVAGEWSWSDSSGVMRTGWLQQGRSWYYLDDSGVMRTGWTQVGSSWYYLGTDGIMRTGWTKIGSSWYFMSGGGQMQTGWLQQGRDWYYLDDSGVMRTGWTQVGSSWYYLGTDGIMRTGWTKIGSSWYFMSGGGQMQTGWLQQGRDWYYLDDSGVMRTGWTQVGSSWYYLGTDGIMRTGWLQQSGSWYYLDGGGVMRTGWTRIGSSWYVMNASGQMRTGWFQQGGSSYYLSASGPMVTGTVTVAGRSAYFRGDGVWRGYWDVSYRNCTEARNSGLAPIYRGEPGYAAHLDRDGDGVACE
ncbi:excalibur calcium-binding domain-containing protein [Salana multivorans]|uniref:excalibur calcium-binding domain-containing protein n=1 Tax=Salana multivorans TaxID=120377 RepID=UPI000F4B542E|nr:excalibur calcium-binding domain-containing protein [Salana multivorans]